MRNFFRSLTDLSLFQQLSVIIVTFGVTLVFFFSVYLRGNINDFVTNQVMSLLARSQSNIVMSINSNAEVKSDAIYDADICHFLYNKGKLVAVYGNRIVGDELYKSLSKLVSEHSSDWSEGTIETKYSHDYYHLNNIDRSYTIISIIDINYGKVIEAQLLSNVSNTSAIVFSVIFFLLIAWVSIIIAPLNMMKNYVDKVRKGDETAKLEIYRKDEIGELANALVSMNEEIRRQEATKEEMIHNISHDLKTPIATIKSYAESIKDGIYPYDTLEKSVDVIIENSDRLEKKVYSLLFLNRLDYVMGQEKDTDRITDMGSLVDDVLLSLKMIRPEIVIERNLEPAFFKGDEESWRVVISNLLDNALRYASSKIVINLQPYHFSISNDGPSLSNERMKKLFRPFEKGTKGKFGLGLSICHKVCNGYGYNIEAENLEKGVIFRITAKEIPKKEKEKKGIINIKKVEKKKDN